MRYLFSLVIIMGIIIWYQYRQDVNIKIEHEDNIIQLNEEIKNKMKENLVTLEEVSSLTYVVYMFQLCNMKGEKFYKECYIVYSKELSNHLDKYEYK